MKRKVILIVFSFFLLFDFAKAITKAPVDITNMSIDELLDAMDKGYITSESLVKMYLERIDIYDKDFNAINQINSNAINDAKLLDEMRKEGKIKGKLHGIPILVKSNIDVVGLSTNAGTLALNENYPIRNSTVVQKLIDEGAIILGSCNMSALAFSASASYGSFGHVKNVFDISKTPLGSSGGSAVAVGASFAAVALGTDTNSSVRAPASAAGLVGIRPTLGLVSRRGVLPYDYERDTVGVLSKTVKDNALLLSIISGYDEEDSVTELSKKVDYNIENDSLNGMKIGVITQYVTGSEKESGATSLTDFEINDLLNRSINLMSDAGAEIINLDSFVKYSNLRIASKTMAGGTFCDYFNDYILGTEGPIKDFKDLASSKNSVWNLSGYLKSCGVQIKSKDKRDADKKIYEEYVLDYFNKYELDVLLYPTIKNKLPLEKNSSGNLIPGNSLGSVIGYPSITVPMGKASDGISYGIEFLSKKYNEDKLYNIALGFEKINKNNIVGTSLTPSLFLVPDSVTELIKVYEEMLNSNDNQKWLDEVKDFLTNYNDYEDGEAKAIYLLDLLKEEESNKENIDGRYFVFALIIICVLIIVKNIFIYCIF